MSLTHQPEAPITTLNTPDSSALVHSVQALLFVSGFSALLLEVVYVRLLRYWVGNTAYSVAAVLCAYMIGLAVGSFAAGKWLASFSRLLAIYGCLELTVGLYSASLPWVMNRLKPAFLALTAFAGSDSLLAFCGQFLASVTLLLIPTLAMGATYPVVVRAASQARSDSPDVAEKLYFTNLAGAALGAVLSDFLLIRFWGLGNSLILVAVVNTLLAFFAVLLQTRQRVFTTMRNENAGPALSPRRGSSMVLLVAFWGGFLVLFLEMVWTSMVGRFLDSTVYAFAAALFAVIAGLGAGAAIVNRRLADRKASELLPYAFLGAGGLVILLIPLWDNARILAADYSSWCLAGAGVLLGAMVLTVDYRARALSWYVVVCAGLGFAVFYRYKSDAPGAAFWILHSRDFAVSALFMIAPAVLMGMIFPLVLRWFLTEVSDARASVGRVYAINTLGCVAGVLCATFVILPRLGVEKSGRFVGLGFVVVGLAFLWNRLARRRWVLAGWLVVSVGWVLAFPAWDFPKTLYFLDHSGDVAYLREDLNAGFTTVLHDEDNWYIFVNDLFNGGTMREERDQARIALLPLLYAHEFKRSMVVGVGTGQSAGIMAQFPFEHIDIVDFSPRVIEAADRYFSFLNFHVFEDPRVQVHIDDGRHYLFTHPVKLSALTLEINRLWTAGEGDLYTREFYEICSAHLTDEGVMQQWVPLFSLNIPETLIIIRTVRQVFPYVVFYLGGGSGMIVASRSPLNLDYSRLRAVEENPKAAAVLKRIDLPGASSLLGDLVLTPEGVDRLLARASERRISTDLWPYLEHSNARYHVGRVSGVPLWQFLLTAQDFKLPPIAGATAGQLAQIWMLAKEERQKQFENMEEK